MHHVFPGAEALLINGMSRLFLLSLSAPNFDFIYPLPSHILHFLTKACSFIFQHRLKGDEPVGHLEMQIRVGAESISGQSGLIMDVVQGHNFKHWEGITGKPSFRECF